MNVSRSMRTATRCSRLPQKPASSRPVQPPSRSFSCTSIHRRILLPIHLLKRSQSTLTAGGHRPQTLRNSQLFLLPHRTSRPITTETRTWIVDSVKGAARVTVYLWAGAFLIYVAFQGFEHDKQEQLTPTPHEWSMVTRYWMREVKRAQYPSQLAGVESPHWIDVGRHIVKTLERLEDPNGDGRDARPALGAGEGDILIEGVGRAGLDISGCPEAWRRGYFDALMTAGTAAEHLEGFVVDRTRSSEGGGLFGGRNTAIFPPQVVIGPSNPNPIPIPFDSRIKRPPREEDCDLFFDPPQKYYMKILTAVGFSSDQKLAAALAYADWLDFKALPGAAADMYEWAMDIAEAAYVARGEQAPYDRNTGTLRRGVDYISGNVLAAISATAEHLAKKGDTARALPAFLTTLRIMRSLPSRAAAAAMVTTPEAGLETITASTATSTTASTTPTSSLLSYFTFLVDPPYPSAPRSGDLPATRTFSSSCEEAAVLAHIGELLYVSRASALPAALLSSTAPASSSVPTSSNAIQATQPQLAGLAWTKQAVDLAESSLRQLTGRDRDTLLVSGSGSVGAVQQPKGVDASSEGDRDARKDAAKTCAQCLDVAVANWQKMVTRLADRERELQADRARKRRADAEASRGAGTVTQNADQGSWTSWFSWLWSGTGTGTGATQQAVARNADIGLWINEARAVEERKMAARRLLREEKLPVNF